MDVRQVQLAEIERVLALIDEYDRPTSQRPSEERIREIYTTIKRTGGCIVGAFYEEGSLLGTCTLNICPNLSWSGRPYGIIENLIVSTNYRNQGIGSQVLNYAKAFAERVGCYKVSLMTGSLNPRIHRFYQSEGFSPSKQGFQVRFDS